MILLEFKSIVEEVFKPQSLSDGKIFTELILLKKAFVDEVGEKYGDDDHFKVTAWNQVSDQVTQMGLRTGTKVLVKVSLTGKRIIDTIKGDGSYHYVVRMNLKNISLL